MRAADQPAVEIRFGRGRDLLLVAVAAGVGAAIAWVDAGPSWDDTGITAGALAGAALVVAAIHGRRPWLWALLIGAPTPVVELATGGNTGSLLALGFAAIGAAGGWLLARQRQEAGRG